MNRFVFALLVAIIVVVLMSAVLGVLYTIDAYTRAEAFDLWVKSALVVGICLVATWCVMAITNKLRSSR